MTITFIYIVKRLAIILFLSKGWYLLRGRFSGVFVDNDQTFSYKKNEKRRRKENYAIREGNRAI